jgi:hypothetical protein
VLVAAGAYESGDELLKMISHEGLRTKGLRDKGQRDKGLRDEGLKAEGGDEQSWVTPVTGGDFCWG